MALDPASLPPEVLTFLGERHLATLTTLRADGSPHVVAVGFSFDPADHVVRVITFAGSQKARNAARGGRAAVSQVDGGRWLTLEGRARLVTDSAGVQRAVEGYAGRYRQPGERADRVAIEIAVDRAPGGAEVAGYSGTPLARKLGIKLCAIDDTGSGLSFVLRKELR